MGKSAADYTAQLVFNIMFWLFILITLGGLLARIYVRVFLRGSIFRLRSWHPSDILVAVTWFGFFVCGFIELFIFCYFDTTPSSSGALADQRFAQQAKLGVVFNTTFWFWVFTIKLAMLCFLNELIPKHQLKGCWYAIRVVAALVIFGGLSSFIYSFLWCLPFERQWTQGDSFCWAAAALPNRRAQRLYRQIWHCGTDVLILAIPIPLIPKLGNLNKRQRLGVAVMLFLGVFCTISAIVYTYYEYYTDQGFTLDDTTANYMQYEPIVELAAAIFIQCVPSMKYLISGRGRQGTGSTNVSEITDQSRNARWDSHTTSRSAVSKFKGNRDEEDGVHVLEMQTSRTNTASPVTRLREDEETIALGGDEGTWRKISDSAIVGHNVQDPKAGWD